MIDIRRYINKLELLKEYMEYFITWSDYFIWMDLQVCEDEYYTKRGLPLPKPYKQYITVMPFEEWLLFINKKNCVYA